MIDIAQLARSARIASRAVAVLPSATKDRVLLALAGLIESRESDIIAANADDLAEAKAAGISDAKLNRLGLTPESLAQMREGLAQIAAMPDPVGRVTQSSRSPAGLEITKVRTPLGVIAMIYEARPGVTIDAFALCFKAGNACLLKGGKEAGRSNRVLAALAREALESAGAPPDAIGLITTSDRGEIRRMLTLTDDIDLVIPRGGESLIRFVHEHSRIPTVQHFKGVCHVFVDATADLESAVNIVATAKTSAPATCNSAECVLIHRDIAGEFVPMLAARARADGFEIRGDQAVLDIANQSRGREHAEGSAVILATDADWGCEFLDLVLAARVVDSIDDAIAHIHRYASNHTESIVTTDDASADRFCREVTSSCVLVNASTRFNDGFQLGLGAEIGISTSKIHAYGPMGLEQLTTERFVVRGSGQTR